MPIGFTEILRFSEAVDLNRSVNKPFNFLKLNKCESYKEYSL